MSAPSTVAVAGLGRMGVGIAVACAIAGATVWLLDLKVRPAEESEQAQGSAQARVREALGLLEAIGLLSEGQVDQCERRIRYASRDEALAEVLPRSELSCIFEAVPEVLTAKQEALSALDSAARSSVPIASTTSSFLATELAQYLATPQRFLNTHWLNPAFLMPLVEVSPSPATTGEVVEAMKGFLRGVGKVPVVLKPSPGYIVPRLQALVMNEAARLVEEGVASPEDIDLAARLGFGIRFSVLGPLEFIDWGGGDILYYASRYLQGSLDGGERFATPEIVAANMQTGRNGLRDGIGFYDFRTCDVGAYQREVLTKLVRLLRHLGVPPVIEVASTSDPATKPRA
jgi:3-hydroxybutyryl-CoA dehydrogenase